MVKLLHEALEKIVPHLKEGCQIFIRDEEDYHKFRIVDGQVCHTESHSHSRIEKGRGTI